MLQYFRLVGLALLLSVGVGNVGQAARINCTKAVSAVENAICSNSKLREWDTLLNVVYGEASKKNQLRVEQKAWIEKRDEQYNNCPEDGTDNNASDKEECLVEEIIRRIVELVEKVDFLQFEAGVSNLGPTNSNWKVKASKKFGIFSLNLDSEYNWPTNIMFVFDKNSGLHKETLGADFYFNDACAQYYYFDDEKGVGFYQGCGKTFSFRKYYIPDGQCWRLAFKDDWISRAATSDGTMNEKIDYITGEIHTTYWEDNSGYTPPDTITKFHPESNKAVCRPLLELLSTSPDS